MMITKKRLVLGAAIISSTVLLASCGKTTTAKELRIVDNCTDTKDLCEFELTDAVVSRYTNILGKTIERVESKTPLHDSDIKGTITWSVNGDAPSKLADNATVQSTLGVSCQDDSCTANSNPTAYNLADGSNTISVSGTVTVDGQTIDLATDVKPITEDTQAAENSFTFQTGALPSGATIEKLVAELNKESAGAHATFKPNGTQLEIDCEDGYEWLTSVNPPYNSYYDSGIGRDIAYAEWNKKDKKFQNSKLDPNNGVTDNGYDSGEIVTWKAGCWKKR